MGPRFVLNRESSIDTTGLDDIDDSRHSGAFSQESEDHAVTCGRTSEDLSREYQNDRPAGLESPILGSLDSPLQYSVHTEDQWRSQNDRPLPTESNEDQPVNPNPLDFRRRHILPPTPTQTVDRHEDPILDSSPPLPSGSGYITPHTNITQVASNHTIRAGIQKRKYDYSSEDEEEIMSPTARRTIKPSLFTPTPNLQQPTSNYWDVLRSANPSITQQSKRFILQHSHHTADANNTFDNEDFTATPVPKTLKPILPSSHLHKTSTIDYGYITPTESKQPKETVNFVQGGLAAGLRSWIIDADARKSAINYAIDNSADDSTRDSRSGKDKFTAAADEKRYALIATINGVQNDNRDETTLSSWCPARHTLVSATRHQVNAEADPVAPGDSAVATSGFSSRQNILLIGLPRQDWRDREERLSTGNGRLVSGDVIGLRHGLIWDIQVPNPALLAASIKGMEKKGSDGVKTSEHMCNWVVAVDWDILSKKS